MWMKKKQDKTAVRQVLFLENDHRKDVFVFDEIGGYA